MRRVVLVMLTLFFLAATATIEAHEVRPAYLELRQTGLETYEVLWKVPAKGDLRLPLEVRFPADCESITPCSEHKVGNAILQRWTQSFPGGLTGRTIAIHGLSVALTDVLVRLERSDGTTQVARLTPSASSFVVETAPNLAQIARTYLTLGVEHILLGMDHLLFVLGLLLVVKNRWMLLKTITSFTVAHSITLGIATLGFVLIPQAPVEAVIALSIIFLASEILRLQGGKEGLTALYPWSVAFIFGLLHGFGFAGALSEVGLPTNDIPLALFLFNLGVEIGQLMFVAAMVTLITLVKRIRIRYPAWAEVIPPYIMGSVATFWLIERVYAFF